MRRQKLMTGLLVGGAAGVIAAVITFLRVPFFENLEMWTYDMRARASVNTTRADPRIVLVDVDDNDIYYVQRHSGYSWPWPRSLFGVAAKHLVDSGAKVVAFDYLFLDPGGGDFSGVERFGRYLAASQNTVIGLQLSRFARPATGRGDFAARIRDYPKCDIARKWAHRFLMWATRAFVVPAKKGCTLWIGGRAGDPQIRADLRRFGRLPDFEELIKSGKPHKIRELARTELATEITPEGLARRRAAIGGKGDPKVKLTAGAVEDLPSYRHIHPPLMPLMMSSKLGVVTQPSPNDGIWRSYAPVLASRGEAYPSLGLRIAQLAFPEHKLSMRGGRMTFGDQNVPLTGESHAMLRFHGSGDVYSRVGIRHVLDVVAQKDERRTYAAGKKRVPAQLEKALKDEDGIPAAMVRGLAELRQTLDEGPCKKKLGKKLKPLRALDEAKQKKPRAIRVAIEFLLVSAATAPPQCRRTIRQARNRQRKLTEAFRRNPKRVRSLFIQMLDLKHPAPCREKVTKMVGHLRKRYLKSPVGELLEVVGAMKKHLATPACVPPPVRDVFAAKLREEDAKRAGNFQRVKDKIKRVEDKIESGSPKNRIFIIHAAAAALRDLKSSSVDKHHLGAEIIATFVDNVINGDFITRAPRGVSALLALGLCLVLGFGTFLIIAVVRNGQVSAVLSLLISGGAVGGFYVLALIFYRSSGIWLDVAAPVVLGSMTWGAAIATNVYQEAKIRRFAQDALGRYTSPALVRELMKNPKFLSLEWGEQRTLSVFFSDVAGFTSISERLGAEKLVKLLNEYLTEMTDIILEHDGIVDKYIGDAVMAFWGAPVADPDHALKACRATLKMRRRLEELQDKWQEEFDEWIEFRAGINSGHAIAGNMGSKHKYNYTLMGDTVNLASRLEGANKPYGTTEMIGEETQRRVENVMLTRELDFLAVKGKERPVRVYELMGEKGGADDTLEMLITRFHEGLDLYRQTEFDKALEHFRAILKDYPGDGPSKLYIKRCRDYIKNPPPLDWDGVFRMTTK